MRLPWLGEVLAPTRVFSHYYSEEHFLQGSPQGLLSLPVTCEPHRVAATVQGQPGLTSTKLLNAVPSAALPWTCPQTLALKAKHKNKEPLNQRRDTNPRAAALNAHWSQENRKGWTRPARLHSSPPAHARGALPQAVPAFEVRGHGKDFLFLLRGPQSFFFFFVPTPLLAKGDGQWEEGRREVQGRACSSLSRRGLLFDVIWY